MTIKGGTYEVVAGEIVRLEKPSGFYVARRNYETVALTALGLSDHIESYRLLAIRENALIGVWANPDNGHTYIDLVDWYADYNNALLVARSNEQIAFWDCAKSEAIPSSAPFRVRVDGIEGISSLSSRDARALAIGTRARLNQLLF